jgi:hypothetical protein
MQHSSQVARTAGRRLAALGAGAALVALAAMPATAAPVTVTVDSVTGAWTSLTGGTNVSGLNSNSVSWGTVPPIGGSSQSGYDFAGVTPLPQTFDVDDVFDLGTFTHRNNPIVSGTSITQATLEVRFQGEASNSGTVPFDITSTFIFDHFETPNDDDPCANGEPLGFGVNGNGCADIVTPVLNVGASESLTIDGTEYFFNVTGFDIGSSFETAEEADNDAVLQGSFTANVDVPEPATLALLGAGLAGIGASARRRRRA